MTPRSSEDGDKVPVENEYEVQKVRNGIDDSPGSRLALLTREFQTLRDRSREDLIIRCIIHPDNRWISGFRSLTFCLMGAMIFFMERQLSCNLSMKMKKLQMNLIFKIWFAVIGLKHFK